jgi:hypothetical protein
VTGRSSKLKGDRAEREIIQILHDLTGWPIERAYGAGRSDDCGDLDGLPGVCAQVKDWADPMAAERAALLDVERQRVTARRKFGVAFIRHRGGRWVVAMTPATFCEMLKETMR